MPVNIPEYQEFLDWCRAQGDDLADKALAIAENRQAHNRTGHIMRGYLAAVPFLLEHPVVRERLKRRERSPINPVDVNDEELIAPWLEFLKVHRKRHDILQHVLPHNLGGEVKQGGGGGYPFKVALRLVADFLDVTDTEQGQAEVPQRYRMVRRREFDRDSGIVRELKQHYHNECQVCGDVMQVGSDLFYCEGHHLRPLGDTHGGPDEQSNIVILCPNHHAEFDHFLFAILASTGRRRKLEHACRDLSDREKHLRVAHDIRREHIDYVVEQFLMRLEIHFAEPAA